MSVAAVLRCPMATGGGNHGGTRTAGHLPQVAPWRRNSALRPMPNRPPSELTRLLEASTSYGAKSAWEAFVRIHSSLLIQATRTLDGDYDSNMDRYAFVLEQLRKDDFRRLRAYRPEAGSKFTTWLVVVAKRLCVDHHRRRYGRPQSVDGAGNSNDPVTLARRRLADLITVDELSTLPDSSTPNPEEGVIARERSEALESELAGLSNRDKLLLTLRFRDGATARQISALMGFPSQSLVYRELNKTLRSLRIALDGRGMGPKA